MFRACSAQRERSGGFPFTQRSLSPVMTHPLLTIHTDGASRGNPGKAAFAYIIERHGGDLIEEAGCLGELTNNQAEYEALVRALHHALELGTGHSIQLNSDSELLIKQMKGEYRVKNHDLLPLYE